MSTRGWLRRALEEEAREAEPPVSPEPTWFDATLDAAIRELGLKIAGKNFQSLPRAFKMQS